ncbi:MAG: hypothetical protein M3490_07900 [Chloroflexota bacterium]|nr:hypothetical protein [Chloroflexota bacterium]
MEQTLLQGYLAERGLTTLAEAMSSEDQSGEFRVDQFNNAVDQGLGEGAFRLVLVLDEAPPELVRLVGYLESVTDKLTIDLITVSSFDVNGRQIVVPRRIDPGHDKHVAESPATGGVKKPSSTPIAMDGTDEFVKSIDHAPTEKQSELRHVATWVDSLINEGIARGFTTVGKGRWILNVRLPDEPVGLVSIYNEKGGSICFYRAAFQRRAPLSISRIEDVIKPVALGKGTCTNVITDRLLAVISDAYREAKRGVIEEVAPDTVGFGARLVTFPRLHRSPNVTLDGYTRLVAFG